MISMNNFKFSLSTVAPIIAANPKTCLSKWVKSPVKKAHWEIVFTEENSAMLFLNQLFGEDQVSRALYEDSIAEKTGEGESEDVVFEATFVTTLKEEKKVNKMIASKEFAGKIISHDCVKKVPG